MSPETQSHRKRYLQLLGAHSAKDLEEKVVRAVVQALHESPQSGLPVRLSRVARQFKIRPRPELITGTHDGEIVFQVPPGEFVIKLCIADTESQLEVSPQPRMRFTYAHEFAHRFFFVESGEKWERALNLVSNSLNVAERMRHRITLRNVEEGLCNRVARRLLIPDDFVTDNCPVTHWFGEGENFYNRVSATARSLGVSRDCLLVRLQDVVPQGASHCAFVVGYSKGPITQRGASKLRIISGLFPLASGAAGSRQFYPGADWANYGASALDFVTQQLQTQRPISAHVPIELRCNAPKGNLVLRGWSRIISAKSVLIWGQLT